MNMDLAVIFDVRFTFENERPNKSRPVKFNQKCHFGVGFLVVELSFISGGLGIFIPS